MMVFVPSAAPPRLPMTRNLELEAALPAGCAAFIDHLARIQSETMPPPPAVAGAAVAGSRVAMAGGRTAALAQLDRIDPVAYARTRNHTAGAVTMLSPWIRHGVLGLAEVRDHALRRARVPDDATKLVMELGWRDYWQQVYAALGPAIRQDIEPPAARRRGGWPLDRVPDDVLAGRTGLACIDAFVRRLHDTGWLHNHERMWLASWLVHTRGVRWQAGAEWFLEHLLDADPASNHLSWQWIAGTFSTKPYLFNRENLESFTGGVHCRSCAVRGQCDVEGSYELLATRLFDESEHPDRRTTVRIRPAPPWRTGSKGDTPRRPLVWVTLDALAQTAPATTAHPTAPRIFVFDPQWLATERPSLKRLVFITECLAEIPGVELHVGDPVAVLRARIHALGCDGVSVADTPCPRVRGQSDVLAADFPFVVERWPRFCRSDQAADLGRFSRYWSRVGGSAFASTSSDA